jgi:transcriptional regulator of acetoin/glycerol metabolism
MTDLKPLSKYVDEHIEEYLVRLMTYCQGNVKAAAMLSKSDRMNMYRLLRRFDLDPNQFRPERKKVSA